MVDKSENENHAKKFGNPKITKDSQTGLSLMEYNGNEQFHDFENITDIRTVFWVVSQKASVNGSGYRFLLCDSIHSDFHNQNDGKFWGNGASKNIRNGSTRLNGNILSGNTNYPNTLSIISLKTTGDVQASRFGQDRHYIGRQWIGHLGELLIYSSALSNEEIQVVEGYLAHKWGLVNSLPNNHPWRNNSAHLFTLDTNGTLAVKRGFNYETDDQNYSLTVRAIDDYGAHAEETLPSS